MFQNMPIYKMRTQLYTQQITIEKEDIQFFRVKTDPDELHPLLGSSSSLLDKDVYILINNVTRKIYLWLGSAAPVRSRFVGARIASTIQREKGMVYRVETVDQDNESLIFQKTLSLLEI